MGVLDDIANWGGRLKRLYDVSKDAKNIEFAETIADLRVALSDWKIKFSDLQEENLKLQAKIDELEQEISTADEIVFRDGMYYRTNPVEGQPNGPFCPNCFEDRGAVISLGNQMPDFVMIAGRFVCPKCKAIFA